MTYREGKVLAYSYPSMEKVSEMTMPLDMQEGWGMTNDGQYIYTSDGTDRIFKIDPVGFTVEGQVQVKQDGQSVPRINSLCLVGGYIYANVFTTYEILKIEAKTGKVVDSWEFSRLANSIQIEDPYQDVMNGIAYRPSTNTFFLTGKMWDSVFEVKLK